mmetsp:Transcript_40395/g.106580  ORF Transcript_40395/g.106580 Transcript_40395/m.106580 type:complete len:515 (+) Transcript_40395:62-1606(+)
MGDGIAVDRAPQTESTLAGAVARHSGGCIAAVSQTGGRPGVRKEDHPFSSEGRVTILAGKDNAPKWTLPQAGRDAATPEHPGPGPAYNVRLLGRTNKHGPNFGPKARHRSAPRLSALATASPGPIYNTRGDTLEEQRTIGGAMSVYPPPPPSKFGVCSTPGPGAYKTNPSTLVGRGSVYMGDPQCRRRPESAPPGPKLRGHDTKAGDAAPKFSFGSASRNLSVPSISKKKPTPESPLYMPPSTLGGPSASCRAGAVPPEIGRFEVRPEPTTYVFSKPEYNSAPQTFGRAMRPLSAPPGPKTIGPGTYHVPDGKVSRPGFGALHSRSKRGTGTPTNEVSAPGPGAYKVEAPQDTHGPAFAFGRAKKAVASEVCGSQATPTHCSLSERAADAVVEASVGDAVSCDKSSLGGRGPRLPPRRHPSVGARKQQASSVPGPGAFNLKAQRSCRSCVFGTAGREARTMVAADSPGPASYNVRSSMEDARRACSFKGGPVEELQRRDEGGPGPCYRAYASIG